LLTSKRGYTKDFSLSAVPSISFRSLSGIEQDGLDERFRVL
jgi:hypothetical protein